MKADKSDGEAPLGAESREALEADARRKLAKPNALPAALRWFHWDGMPPVLWDDSGLPVSPLILRWFAAQSVKRKQVEPSAAMLHCCAQFRSPGREALASYVLAAWLHEDVKPPTRAEAEPEARARTAQLRQHIARYPDAFDPVTRNASDAQLFEHFLNELLSAPAGSAIRSKGILALVAACGGAEIAPLTQRYLKQYYGTRAAQGKALIQMLAWVPHPSATQLMLSIGTRFRTRGFQDEAHKQAALLAERKGWSLDELADRTIPSAGFDESGEASFDYGARTFRARLNAALEIELFNPEGKQISSLPNARKDEDEARVQELKARLNVCRKELKSVLSLQSLRLYEAMCTGRQWKAADWTQYLQRHPIAGPLAQRLVWLARPGDLSFRPLADGTLSDRDDNELQLPEGTLISLAHDSQLTQAVSEAWLRHLSDYKIDPLFPQFGRGTFQLSEQDRRATELHAWLGYVLPAFTLRNRATKHGYVRGPAQDGGWFDRYQKAFPSLGLTANIEFTGNSLPEDNREVALCALSFERSEPLPLADVPPVLLQETWNDMRQIAEEGVFRADWDE